jgi:Asp-tRNA(Asn)/Glu-tRNA(Gln) amidotransferase A subunit family amidase
LAPDHEQIFRSAVEAAVDAGAAVAEVPFDGLDMIRDVFATVQLAEAYFTHSVQLGTYPSRAEDYGSDVRMRLEAASHVTVAEYLQARAEVGRIEERFAALFEQVDAILTPVAAGPPSRVAGPDVVRHLDQDLSFRDLVMGYTVPQNLTGLPACVIPAGMDALGLPVGVQITGPRGRDDFPLRVASALEARLGPLRRSAPRFP